jgi:hypothetical protein
MIRHRDAPPLCRRELWGLVRYGTVMGNKRSGQGVRPATRPPAPADPIGPSDRGRTNRSSLIPPLPDQRLSHQNTYI